jgi:hypothetical protein
MNYLEIETKNPTAHIQVCTLFKSVIPVFIKSMEIQDKKTRYGFFRVFSQIDLVPILDNIKGVKIKVSGRDIIFPVTT